MLLTTPIPITRHDGTTINVPFVTLLTWQSTLRMEAKGYKHSAGSIFKIVWGYLIDTTPPRATVARRRALQTMVDDLVDQVKAQIESNNEEMTAS